MSEEAKKFIQEAAWHRFPAEELWIRADNSFWAFLIEHEDEHDTIFTTEGFYQNGNITANTAVRCCYHRENYIQPLIEKKRNEGYECFAIQMKG